MKEHGRGQAVVSSRQNHDIEDQETGVELALKLPQIVSIANYAKAPAKDSFILRLPICRAERHFSLRHRRGVPSAWVANISLQNSSHPAEVSPLFFFFSAPHSPFLTIAFFLSHKLKRGSRHRFSKLKDGPPQFSPRHLSLSLSLCPAIPKFKDPRYVFFLFLYSKLVAAAFSLPRARCLFADSGTLQLAIAFFFFSLSRFSTLLIFVFRSFFRQGTRQPYAKPRNSGGDMPAAFLRRERQGRGSISSPSSRSKSFILRLWIRRGERHFALRHRRGSISGPRYQLTNLSPSRK